MALELRPLRMYTMPVDHEPLPLEWVEEQLAGAGTYWVAASGDDPHPRPVWGVWSDGRVMLTLGSPPLRRAIGEGSRVTVHLPSSTDVVVLSGHAAVESDPSAVEAFVRAYDEKYDYHYDAETYGPPTVVTPDEIVAWRAAGEHGRDGFRASGKWSA